MSISSQTDRGQSRGGAHENITTVPGFSIEAPNRAPPASSETPNQCLWLRNPHSAAGYPESLHHASAMTPKISQVSRPCSQAPKRAHQKHHSQDDGTNRDPRVLALEPRRKASETPNPQRPRSKTLLFNWNFPKIRVPYFGVLIIRILLFRVLF